jgi:hypothetical protein
MKWGLLFDERTEPDCHQRVELRIPATVPKERTYLDNEVEGLFGEEFHSSVLLA